MATGYGSINTIPNLATKDPQGWFVNLWQGKYHLESSPEQLAQAIMHGLAVAASDSSFQDQSSAAAWMIKGETAANSLNRAGQTPGWIYGQSSYCSKLFGLWGVLLASLE